MPLSAARRNLMDPCPAPRRAHRRAVGLAVVLLLPGLAGCVFGPGQQGPAPATSSATAAAVETITEDLDAPWSITFTADGIPLVSERDTARILELDADGGAREVGTIDGVGPRGEGGLLGIAAHEGYLYTYFTGRGENRIERRELTGTPGALGLGPAQTLLAGIPAGAIHNGGRLAFGPDGLLYATTGDAGNSEKAQDRAALAGKILRLEPDGAVPDDNPFPGSPVYSYGHRNPQGLAWDADGTLYASEFGQNTWDELNVIDPGGNYGWPAVEGAAGAEAADGPDFVDPVQQWEPAAASPSGIAVAGGSVWIANLRGERLREVPLDDTGTATEYLVGEHGRLRDVVTAPDGALWVLTNNTDGRGSPAAGDDRILRVDVGG